MQPFFLGEAAMSILNTEHRDPTLFKKPSKNLRGNSWFLNQGMVEKDGESIPRIFKGAALDPRNTLKHG